MNKVLLGGLSFEPLQLIVVIESRFSVRQEVTQQIRALGLFEEVVEAKSVNDGRSILDIRAVDCCVFGLGLNEAAAIEFVQQAKEATLSKYCGYIKMTSVIEKLEYPDAFDAILEMPADKPKLAACVVAAILNSSKGAPWHETIADSGISEKELLDTIRLGRSPTTAPAAPSTKVITTNTNLGGTQPLEQLSKSGTRRIPFGPPLAQIISGLDDQKIAKLGAKEVDEMADLISKKIGIELPRSPSGADPADAMKQYVKDWLTDRKTLSGYQAFRKLARKLTRAATN